MKKLFLLLVLVIASTLVVAAPEKNPTEEYIKKWSATAVSEMYRSGVPASITLAQGILESASGSSYLALRGNNHFGIKCHNWKGATIYADDDKKGECFRKYPNAAQSFSDHSDFLRYWDRYKPLFELKTTDYKGWAYGLKKAGYATDPNYATKLIDIIEKYDLSRFDVQGQGTSGGVSEGKRIPQTPSQLETPVPVSQKVAEKIIFSLNRNCYSQNKVLFIYSLEGETYRSIAKKYNLFLAEILRFNDLDSEKTLAAGTVVYLQVKKAKAARGVDKYVAEGGESLYEIAQRFGVRMKNLLKRNPDLNPDSILVQGQMILLR